MLTTQILLIFPHREGEVSRHAEGNAERLKAGLIHVRPERRLFLPTIDPVEFRFLSHVIVDEKHKFLVCTVPKVASSEWKKLFLRLIGDPDWRSEPWWKHRNLTTLYKLGIKRSREILGDSSWTKAVVFREPAARLLSCFLDKFVNGTERSRKYSLKVFKEDHILTFEEFLKKIAGASIFTFISLRSSHHL